MDKKYCVYIYTNKINGKVYIGQTCNTLEERARKDGSGYKRCTHFYRAIQKYGWENFEAQILESNLTLEEANLKEQYYIKLYDSMNKEKGYNCTSGGKQCELSEETKKKLSEAHKGKKGCPHTEEYKQQMKQKMIERWQNEDERKKLCEKMKENHADFKRGNSPLAKKIMRMDTKEIFSCTGEAAESIGKDYIQGGKNIAKAARGKRKTAYGFEWRYVE